MSTARTPLDAAKSRACFETAVVSVISLAGIVFTFLPPFHHWLAFSPLQSELALGLRISLLLHFLAGCFVWIGVMTDTRVLLLPFIVFQIVEWCASWMLTYFLGALACATADVLFGISACYFFVCGLAYVVSARHVADCYGGMRHDAARQRASDSIA